MLLVFLEKSFWEQYIFLLYKTNWTETTLVTIWTRLIESVFWTNDHKVIYSAGSLYGTRFSIIKLSTRPDKWSIHRESESLTMIRKPFSQTITTCEVPFSITGRIYINACKNNVEACNGYCLRKSKHRSEFKFLTRLSVFYFVLEKARNPSLSAIHKKCNRLCFLTLVR